MKKPTFSIFPFWLLSFSGQKFLTVIFDNLTAAMKLQSLKNPIFQRKAFSAIQNKTTVFVFFLFLITTLSSFTSAGDPSLFRINPKNIGAAENIFLTGNDSLKNKVSGLNEKDAVKAVAALVNPVFKYAQLPYAGQISTCPNDGKKLPKLFLCGGNDSRLIDTGITDAISITWEKFISGGSCAAVSNSDCANESAASSCWVQIATGKDYLANSAGQFRVKIVESNGTPNVFYFNVYQNTLIPTATVKSNIVKYGASCKIDGKITVSGFGSGYEYSFTTGTTPGTWQDSNVFTTGTAGTYTAFIRIKGVVGSCEFKVINLEIKSVDFKVTTSIASPKCNSAKGSVQVITNNVGQQYIYEIYNTATPAVLISSSGTTSNADYFFNGLNSGTYTIKTYIVGSACAIDVQNVVVANAPSAVTSTAAITTALGICSTGQITVTPGGGTGVYKYYVNIDGAGFVENPTKVIIVDKSGSYVIRVEDSNGCVANNITVNVPVVDKPSYSIIKTDGDCKGALGSIKLNVSNAKSYTITYTVNGGTSRASNYITNNLLPGIYKVSVRYKKSGVNNGNNCVDPDEIITIGSSTALTASAGVAELSGCGPSPNELYGKIRIVNPQGGTPYPAPNPYRYSFGTDSGGNKIWITSNEAYVNYGGPYTVYIQDAAGCEYAMGGITIDKKPNAPTISVDNPVFNCDGSATSTVTVTNSGSGDPNFSYKYYMDGVLNMSTPSNIFKNVTQGDHIITVEYNVLSVSTYSNLLQEDFGKGGFTTTPGINPAYCFEDEATTHLLPGYTCNTDEWINDGEYAVASKIRTTFSGSWITANDHTLPDDPLGRFLVVNVGGTAGIGGILYSKPIKDVIANQDVIISLWAENLIVKTSTTHDDPKLTIQLVNNLNGVGGTETIVATTDTTNPWVIPKSEKWEYKELSLNPGAYTNLSFVVRSYSNQFNGNDVLIDDIWVRQIPKSCNSIVNFPIIVDGSKAFSASITGYKDVKCKGDQNGEITISAKNFDPVKGFQYLVNGVLPWVSVIPSPAATSGSKTLTNLSGGVYNIQIRYDSSANSCTFPVAQEIKMPSAVTASASITTLPTCTTGATITAVGGGGTPAYQYQLVDNNDSSKNRPFQVSDQFVNVPAGSYTVFVRDANSCASAAGFPITVTAPTPPTASLKVTTDYCYTTADPATLVVNITGGVGPFDYKLDTNAAFNSGLTTHSFSNVAAGSHTIVVTDNNTCTSTIASITVAQPLTLGLSLIQDLTCLTNASIGNPVITGGYLAPYSYSVSLNGGNPTAVNSFPYSVSVDGSYVFKVTDSKGCPASSNAVIVSAKTTPIITDIKKTDITCNNKNDGTVAVTASNGFSTTYTYAIKLSSATTYTTQNTNLFTDLAAGTYNIKVIDTKGCESAVSDVTIVNPTAVGGTIGATELGCSSTGTIDAIVTVNGSGGTAPYKYSFNGTSNFTSVNTFSTGTDQTVTAYVQDANGCQFGPLSVVIAPKSLITGIDVFFETGLECPAYKAHVKFQAIGGLSPIRYQVTAVPSGITIPIESSGQYSLDPGDYIFRAIDKNGCSFDLNYNVKSVPDITAGGSIITPIKCFGGTGAIEFTVGGLNSHKYDYVVTNTLGTTIDSKNNQSAATISLSNLAASNYTIEVKDRTTGCKVTYAVNLTQPAVLSITSATPTKVNCNNDNSQITIVTAGGTTNYSYAYAKNPSTDPTSAYDSNAVQTVDTNSGVDLIW
ncbi:hypothetical protein, partial [Flavobacterium sp. HJJ]|uniref:hypothetical protein n=1 Tax=Flavobacterium sp. HJJ TaxID=2783792 RepID=UPI00188BAE29